jgi:hypothetical protein
MLLVRGRLVGHDGAEFSVRLASQRRRPFLSHVEAIGDAFQELWDIRFGNAECRGDRNS